MYLLPETEKLGSRLLCEGFYQRNNLFSAEIRLNGWPANGLWKMVDLYNKNVLGMHKRYSSYMSCYLIWLAELLTIYQLI